MVYGRAMRLRCVLPVLALAVSTTTPFLTVAESRADQPRVNQAVAKCKGQRATVVGDPAGGTVTGTRGPDIIVSNGAGRVNALAGDDLICLTGAPPNGFHRVNADNGSDIVHNSTALRSIVQMGLGRAVFTGGPATDHVTTAPARSGRGPSRIFTGAGRDVVSVDTVVEPGLVLRGGPGVDAINPTFRRPARTDRLTINSRIGRATVGSVRFRLAGFERFNLVEKRLTFRGRNIAEFLNLRAPDPGEPYQVAAELGGGDDQIRVESSVTTTTALRAGRGDDLLVMDLYDIAGPVVAAVSVDLVLGTLTRNSAGRYPVMELLGFNDLDLEAKSMTIVGSAEDNTFRLSGCDGSVDGGAGPDDIAWSSIPFEFDSPCREGDQLTLRGGNGDDRLTGSDRDDVLIGGEGIDTADGGAGEDSCDAETTLRCETIATTERRP